MQTIECPITTQANNNGSFPAILLENLELIDYQTLDMWVSALSEQLQAQGIQKGQRVALISPNTPELLILFFALLRIESIALLVPIRFPLHQIEKTIIPLQCTTWFLSESLYKKYITPSADVYCIETVIHSAQKKSSPNVSKKQPRLLKLEQEATILLTSGSSGAPKAVLHTLKNHLRSAQGSNQNIGLQSNNDRWLMSLPLYHVAGIGIAFRCFCAGACIAYPNPSDNLHLQVQKQSITHISLVTTQLQRLLKQSLKKKNSSLKAILLGGSAIPSSLLYEGLARGLPLYTSYGSTEMSSQITCEKIKTLQGSDNHSGKTLNYRKIKIAKNGEVCVSGETRFKGYLTPDGLSFPFDDDGWFATGDLGKIDTEGQLRIIGRKDNMFISGGENIQPEEIEQALCELHFIQKAIVLPFSDPEFGEKPIAIIQYIKEDFSIDEVREHLKRSIASFKIPKHFLPWPKQEYSAGIKVSRIKLHAYAKRKMLSM